MSEKPRWFDLILACVVVGLSVAVVFLFMGYLDARQDKRSMGGKLEKLKDWHIHVSSELSARGLDVAPVLTAEDLEGSDVERTGREDPNQEDVEQ